MRITSITPMKDEAPFLLEWVAYHRLIGVNDILVFTNDCTDGTDLMLERLDEMGLVRHYANPSSITGNTRHHLQVIRYVNAMPRLARSDWVVSLDVDEFICVNAGEGRLQDLFAATAGANVIFMNQHNFGSGDRRGYEDGLLIEGCRHAWRQSGPYHRRIDRRGVKTLTHASSGAREWHNHSPVFAAEALHRVRAVNGSGLPVTDEDFTRDVKSLEAPRYGFDLVQLNHYVLKSVDAYLLKVARGNANHADDAYEMAYWQRYDHNDIEDRRIARWVPQVAAFRDELLADPELGRLHAAAVLRAAEVIADMRAGRGKALWGQLQRYRDKRPVPALAAMPDAG